MTFEDYELHFRDFALRFLVNLENSAVLNPMVFPIMWWEYLKTRVEVANLAIIESPRGRFIFRVT